VKVGARVEYLGYRLALFSCSIRLAILVRYRLVTDGQTQSHSKKAMMKVDTSRSRITDRSRASSWSFWSIDVNMYRSCWPRRTDRSGRSGRTRCSRISWWSGSASIAWWTWGTGYNGIRNVLKTSTAMYYHYYYYYDDDDITVTTQRPLRPPNAILSAIGGVMV